MSIHTAEDGRIMLEFEGETSLEEIGSALAFEFLTLTPLGKLTILEILLSLYIYSKIKREGENI